MRQANAMDCAPSPATAGAPTRHFAHIDGLRAIAVLAVIAFHLRETWLPGGFLGVDVFFVISGFVVSHSVANWNGGHLGHFLAFFYSRRMLRILPALLVCLLATMLLTTLFVPPVWLGTAVERTGAHAFFGISNFFLARNREQYFSATIDYNPFMHTWSLGVEEQFYLLFPLLFFVWTRGPRWRLAATAVTTAALVGSYLWATKLARHDPTAAFYLIAPRLWELAAGVLLFQCAAAVVRIPAWARSAIAWCGALLLAYTLVKATTSPVPAPHPLLSVIATVALIAGMHANTGTWLSRMLGTKPLTWIGRASYSLYLWHWPVFVLMRWTIGIDTPLQMLVGIGVTFALAALSTRFVERPLRYSTFLMRWPRPAIVACGLVVMLLSWSTGKAIHAAQARISLSTVAHHMDDWQSNLDSTLPKRPGCVLVAQNAQIGQVKPITIMTLSRQGCPAPQPAPPRIIVMGDSHATALWKMMSRYVLLTGATVEFHQNLGCTFASLQPEREGGLCPQGNATSIQHIIANAQPNDILLLASLRVARWTDQFALRDEAIAWSMMTSPAARQSRQGATAALIDILGPVVARGVRVILTSPAPILHATPYRCADWFNAGNPICQRGLTVPRDETLRYGAQVRDSLAAITYRLESTYVWDPLPILCPGTTCAAWMDGKPLYADGDHLSGYANLLLLPDFERFVAELPAPRLPETGDAIFSAAK